MGCYSHLDLDMGGKSINQKVKLERLRSTGLIRRDLKATNSRHVMTSKVIGTQAY
jgi:hypothetical protein